MYTSANTHKQTENLKEYTMIPHKTLLERVVPA